MEDEITDIFSRPCACAQFEENPEKSFCYIEGTKIDKKSSENTEELTENVWFESKPPRMFKKIDSAPSITARQVEIARIRLAGRHLKANEEFEDSHHKEKINVSIHKKKSAVHFLSSTTIDENTD